MTTIDELLSRISCFNY